VDPGATAQERSRVIPLQGPASAFLILIPALDEESRIGPLVEQLASLYPQASLIVVDDGSTDGTAEEARAAGAQVLTHPFHMGYGAALQTGYKYAIERDVDLLVQMDGDGQHPPAEVQRLLEGMRHGDTDLVVGSRFLGRGSYRMPWLRKAGSFLFSRVTSGMLGRRVTDPTSGFQAMNARTLRFYRQDFYPYDYPDADILIRAGYHGLRFDEVPVEMYAGLPGKSMHRGLRPLYYVYKLLLSICMAWITGRLQSRHGA